MRLSGEVRVSFSSITSASLASLRFFGTVARSPQLLILKTIRSVGEIYGMKFDGVSLMALAAVGMYGDCRKILAL